MSYSDVPVRVEWDATTGAPATEELLATRVYKGRGLEFGAIGETTKAFFEDAGYQPNLASSPRQGRDPFLMKDTLAEGFETGTVIAERYPKVVGMFEERRVFGHIRVIPTSSVQETPAELLLSRTGDYSNFDTNPVPVDDGPLAFELASHKREEIRWLRPVGPKLLAGTNASVWAVSGSGGEALSPTTLPYARVQSEVGSLWVNPVVAGDALLYARAKGSGLRALLYSNEQDSYAGADVSVHVKHLFRGRNVVEMAWLEDPLGILWVLFDDGSLASLTFSKEAGTAAWAEHETDGVVYSICSVPEGEEDRLYLVVGRTNSVGVEHVGVERLASREIQSLDEAVFLDGATVYSGAPTSTVSGLDRFEGVELWALADGNVVEELVVDGGEVTLPYPASRVVVGLRYDSTVELLDVAEARTKAKVVRRAYVEVVESRGLWVGEDEDSLFQWQQREVEDDEDPIPLETTEVEIDISHDWNKGGRVVLQQRDPLPLTIVGVTREVEVGGD